MNDDNLDESLQESQVPPVTLLIIAASEADCAGELIEQICDKPNHDGRVIERDWLDVKVLIDRDDPFSERAGALYYVNWAQIIVLMMSHELLASNVLLDLESTLGNMPRENCSLSVCIVPMTGWTGVFELGSIGTLMQTPVCGVLGRHHTKVDPVTIVGMDIRLKRAISRGQMGASELSMREAESAAAGLVPRLPTLLCVDDDLGLLEAYEAVFSEGYNVVRATNFWQAVEAIHKHEPDVAIVDMYMREVDGLGVCQYLLRTCPFSAAIIISAYASIQTVMACLEIGVSDYIMKPFECTHVQEKVDRLADTVRLRRAVQSRSDGAGHRTGASNSDLVRALYRGNFEDRERMEQWIRELCLIDSSQIPFADVDGSGSARNRSLTDSEFVFELDLSAIIAVLPDLGISEEAIRLSIAEKNRTHPTMFRSPHTYLDLSIGRLNLFVSVSPPRIIAHKIVRLPKTDEERAWFACLMDFVYLHRAAYRRTLDPAGGNVDLDGPRESISSLRQKLFGQQAKYQPHNESAISILYVLGIKCDAMVRQWSSIGRSERIVLLEESLSYSHSALNSLRPASL